MDFYQASIERGRRLYEAGFTGASHAESKEKGPQQAKDEDLQRFIRHDRAAWVARVEEMFAHLPEGFFDVEIIG